MRTMLIISLLLFNLAHADFSVFGDAYTFDENPTTEVFGIRYDNLMITHDLDQVAVGYYAHVGFENVEFGALFELSDELKIKPYYMTGSDLYLILMMDELTPTVRVGFKLF